MSDKENPLRKFMQAGMRDIYRGQVKKIDGKMYQYAYSVYSEEQKNAAKRQLERSGLSYRILDKTMFGKMIGWEVYVAQPEQR